MNFYTNRLKDINPEQKSKDEFHGQTPLHYAAQNGHLKIVKHLSTLVKEKNPPDSNGATPLHLAAMFGHLEIVTFLHQNTKDKTPKWNGKTPTDLAAKWGHLEVVKYLVEEFQNEVKNYSLNCLNYAKNGNKTDVIQFLEDYFAKLDLKEAKAKINEPNNDCTICLEPRSQSYAFVPCGHATFCKKCSEIICMSKNRKCPTVQLVEDLSKVLLKYITD